jgi:hypothetical protein
VLIEYGTFALPFGPNKLLFKNASGPWARLAENWQASWIVNLSSGAPLNISAQNQLYNLGVPDIVGPFDVHSHNFGWTEGAAAGGLFSSGNNGYTKVQDPQCTNPNLVVSYLGNSPACTINAIQDSSGHMIFQTPLPGTRGTFGQNRIEGLGTWTADMTVQKRIMVAESKSFTVRLDASNVFNHPTPALGGGGFFGTPGAAGIPDLSLQSAVPFGVFNTKVGSRTFQLKARMDF